MHHRSDYDFDVISGPSTPPPARPAAFRPPPEPREPRPPADAASAPSRPAAPGAAQAGEEV